MTLPDGSKEALHRHNWLVIADVSSDKLNSMGLVMDFRQLRKMLEKIVADFDNIRLEKNDYFNQNTASAEAVAKYIYEKLAPRLPAAVKLQHIKVIEEPGCWAKFGK